MALLRSHIPRGLAARVAGLAALCAVALAVALSIQSVGQAEDAADAQLDARAAALERKATAALAAGSGRRALDRIGEEDGAEVRLERAPRRDGESRSDSGGSRTYRFPVRGARRSLVVELPTDSIDDARRGALVRAAGTSLAALALLFVLMWLLVHRSVAAPLRRLREAVERLSRGAYEERATVAGAPEVADAARAVNVLAKGFADLGAQASTDPLTGVANRRMFHAALEAELKRADRYGEPMALVVIDLDGFKAINDTHGHPFGDRALREMAGRLQSTMRATDVLARVGGDEFAMILPGMGREPAGAVVERAREATARNVDGIDLTWRAGIACYPGDAQNGTTLLECADAALYCAKSAGSYVCHYDPDEMQGPPGEGVRSAVEAVLNDPDAVVMAFQPLVSLTTGRIAGYEALARFPKPPARRPDEWFELAHRAGLGPQLEARAVREALACPGRPADTYLSFNLSPSAIASPEVRAVLPHDLSDFVVEITEHERIADDVSLQRDLDALRARGARVAIDDAGAGYSGLQQVMRVHPDLIKLDRSLVANVDKDPAKAALIDSFVRFGRRTGAAVCAEGIETAEELKLLADLDVSYGQGFGLARPAEPWAGVGAWVAGTIRVRRMGGPDDLGTKGDAQQNADLRLADVVARVATVSSRSELYVVGATIAAEVGADEVVVFGRREGAVEALTPGTAVSSGEQLALSNYSTLDAVLSNRDSIQMLRCQGAADLGVLSLLERSGHGSTLVTPIVLAREVLGVLQCFSEAERHWSHSEASRARIIAHQLGPVLARLSPEPAPPAAEAPAVSDPGPAHVGP
jgi:diguanylate cyclase (GGDEF)-like protein